MGKLFFSKMVAEAIGTFGIVFIGCGAVMVAERYPGSFPPGGVAIVFGLVVAALVYTLGHISGAHFNPAVTLAFALVNRFKKTEVLPYWISQFLGGLVATVCLWVLLPPGRSFGATLPVVTALQAVVWEAIMTFFLMFAVMSVATDRRAVGTLGGIVVGAVVGIDAFVGGPLTGASMNPARSFGPMWAEGRLDVFWIYVLGPVVGALLAAFAYEWIRGEEELIPE
jgi:MIP family channel proteins